MADEDLEVRAILSADASKFITPFQQATVATQQLHKALKPTSGLLVAAGTAAAASGYALFKYGKEAFAVAARVSEMNVAIKAVGKATGLGEKAISDTAKAVRKQGIEMASAQKIALTYAQNNLNLADASKVARVAQDLAVITQKNSTDTAELLNRAIQTGSTILLKSAGITKYASEGYKAYAKQLGKSTHDLTALERQQATTNLILEEGRKVAGLYEAAMTEPGKVLRSFARLQDDIKIEMGSVLLSGFGPMIKASYDLVKAFSESVREGGYFHEVLKVAGSALVAMTQPLTDGILRLTNFIKSLKDSEIGVDGLKQKMQQFTPIILAVSTALSALAGRSLLNLLKLGKLGAMLNPLTIGFAMLAVLSPRLRDAFSKIAKTMLPLIPAVISLGKALAEFVANAVDGFASLMESGLGAVLETAFKAITLAVLGVSKAIEKFKPLGILVGLVLTKIAVSMAVAGVATSAFGTRLLFLKAGFTNLIGSYKFAVAEQMRYNYTLSQGGFAITKFSTMATVGFRMVAIAAKSLIVSLAPMLAIFAAVHIFSKFREAQQKVKDRTNELTQAFKEQIYELKGNSVAIAEYVNKADTLGDIFLGAGADADKLKGALNVLGVEQSRIGQIAKDGTDGYMAFNKEMMAGIGISNALVVASDDQAFVFQNGVNITKSLTAEQKMYADALGVVNEALNNTDLAEILNQQMLSLTATDQLAAKAMAYAITEAEKQGILEDGIDTVTEAIAVNEILKEKYLELAKAAKAKKDAEEASTAAVKGATHAAKPLYERLMLLKSANEDGKVSVEAFAKEMFGAQVETNTFAQAVDDMRKQSSELANSVKGTKGNFDAFTSSGFDLYNQITKNSSSLLELGGNSADVRNYMKSAMEQFRASAKAAKFTDDQVTDLYNSLGLISGLAEIDIQVTIDLTSARKQLALFITQLASVHFLAGGEARQGIADMSKAINDLTKSAEKGTGAFGAYNTELDKDKKESKEVTKEKERLRNAIMKIANEALNKATKRMEEYRDALNSMKDASRQAIYGAYSLSDALSRGDIAAEKAGENMEKLKETNLEYGKSIKDAIRNVLSFNSILSEQKSAKDELSQADKKVAEANFKVLQEQAEYQRLLDLADKAAGRKKRRESYEKAAEQLEKITDAQKELTLATVDATEAEEKQMSFMEKLREQAQLARKFSSQLAQLAQLGLEKDAFNQIVEAGAETGSLMATELIGGGAEAIKETNDLFKEIAKVSLESGKALADDYVKIGEDSGTHFVVALAQQAQKVHAFADTVKRLVEKGLSPQNIQQVLSAGYEAGSRIAAYIEAGGANTIAQLNAFEVGLREQGESLADLLGNTFYQSGFDLASQIVDGIKDKIEELNDFLADATIGEMKAYLARAQAEFDAILAKLPGAPSTVLNPNAPPVLTIGEAISQVLTPGFKVGDGRQDGPPSDQIVAIAKPIMAVATTMSGAISNIAEQTAVLKGFITQNEADALFQRRFGNTNLMPVVPSAYSGGGGGGIGGSLNEMTMFAKGGIVKSPTLGIVGEAGPEAIIPLSKMGAMGGQTINLTVNAGYGADGRAIGDVIVNELKKWSRKNGKIPVPTQ